MKDIHLLENIIRGSVRHSEPLKGYTTFRIGGPCTALIEPADFDDLKKAVDFLMQEDADFFVIGGGSNLLVNDSGIKSPVLRLKNLKDISVEGTGVKAQSGARVSDLLDACAKSGLSGLEFLAGIPATVGGALVMNAGWALVSIGDFVEDMTILEEGGTLKDIPKETAGFRYRSSDLKGVVIVEASFRLSACDPSEVKKRIRDNIEIKKESQDLAHPSAGCVFKNPNGQKAWKLIDSCGLRGRRIGRAAVSEKHANFIINLGDATSDDVLKLMDEIEKKVECDCNVRLEREIEVIG